jgi:hypothetical protein
VDEAQEDWLGTDERVVEQVRFLLRQHEHPSTPVCEAFEHFSSIAPARHGTAGLTTTAVNLGSTEMQAANGPYIASCPAGSSGYRG